MVRFLKFEKTLSRNLFPTDLTIDPAQCEEKVVKC